ncbi:hypothetical protein LTR50_002900 [Elasticomyces elasticus]|nr:hypothetical protein LTR50_002900 [Elasticomyces elasticus]
MDPTTLMTFLYKSPPGVRSVELLGSWDGFSKPYRMELDPRKGSSYWTGCHKFKNIICDGELTGLTQPRTGGLKQGGRYWYYYRLDNDNEHHDPTMPSTNACPLMPGQIVNIIDVPVETQNGPVTARSLSVDAAHALVPRQTLEPTDKYVKPKLRSLSKLPRLFASLSVLNNTRERHARMHDPQSDQIDQTDRAPEGGPRTKTPPLRKSHQHSASSSRSGAAALSSLDCVQRQPVCENDRAIVGSPAAHSAESVSELARHPSELQNPTADIQPFSTGTSGYTPQNRPATRYGVLPTTDSDVDEGTPQSELDSIFSNALRSCLAEAQDLIATHTGRGVDLTVSGVDSETDRQTQNADHYAATPSETMSALVAGDCLSLSRQDEEPFDRIPQNLSSNTSPHPAENETRSPASTTLAPKEAAHSPLSERSTFDISSPTFSAATVSSGGLDTPAWRLSSQSATQWIAADRRDTSADPRDTHHMLDLSSALQRQIDLHAQHAPEHVGDPQTSAHSDVTLQKTPDALARDKLAGAPGPRGGFLRADLDPPTAEAEFDELRYLCGAIS